MEVEDCSSCFTECRFREREPLPCVDRWLQNIMNEQTIRNQAIVSRSDLLQYGILFRPLLPDVITQLDGRYYDDGYGKTRDVSAIS